MPGGTRSPSVSLCPYGQGPKFPSDHPLALLAQGIKTGLSVTARRSRRVPCELQVEVRSDSVAKLLNLPLKLCHLHNYESLNKVEKRVEININFVTLFPCSKCSKIQHYSTKGHEAYRGLTVLSEKWKSLFYLKTGRIIHHHVLANDMVSQTYK